MIIGGHGHYTTAALRAKGKYALANAGRRNLDP
jgi:hypothetical protein